MTELINTTLQNAYETQQPEEKFIFHSDLGSQYTSDVFVSLINKFNIKNSFSYKGNSCDNACIESFHAILKRKEDNHVQCSDKNRKE